MNEFATPECLHYSTRFPPYTCAADRSPSSAKALKSFVASRPCPATPCSEPSEQSPLLALSLVHSTRFPPLPSCLPHTQLLPAAVPSCSYTGQQSSCVQHGVVSQEATALKGTRMDGCQRGCFRIKFIPPICDHDHS